MKYLLVVGFFCDVYRREPRARIFFNNKMIDEFNIQDQQENTLINTFKNTNHILEPRNLETHREYIKKSLPPLHFYEIEIDNRLKQTNIHIEIDNNDSDYTNGFMKRSTLLQFRVLSLLPFDKNIYSWFLKKKIDKIFTYRYPWYRRHTSNIFFSFSNYTFANTKWIGNNGQKIDASIKKEFNILKIGGSGNLYCPVIKKYGILLPKLLDQKKYCLLNIDRVLVDSIYNKYEQYENQ
jgi:hypothetical protein